MPSRGSVSALIAKLPNQAAIGELWDRYYNRLERLAKSPCAIQLQRKVAERWAVAIENGNPCKLVPGPRGPWRNSHAYDCPLTQMVGQGEDEKTFSSLLRGFGAHSLSHYFQSASRPPGLRDGGTFGRAQYHGLSGGAPLSGTR